MDRDGSNTIVVPHACVHNHRWRVDLPYGYYYPNPSQRFCKACLEADRIEVASIQLFCRASDTATLEYICPICEKGTIIPLPLDFSFVAMTQQFLKEVEEGLTLESFSTPRLSWYHLPKRWPVRCEHTLDQEWFSDMLPRRS